MRRDHLVFLGVIGVAWAWVGACGEDTADEASTTSANNGPTVSATSATGGSSSATSNAGGNGGTSAGGMAAGGMAAGGMAAGGMAAGGSGGMMMMGSQKAYYWGDFDTDTVVQVATVEWPNALKTVLMPQGLSGGSAINSVAVSPNGMNIAVAGRDMMGQSYVLNVYSADGMGAPTLIVDVSTQSNVDAQIGELAYSPDGTWIAYVADFSDSFVDGIYVSPANGSAPPKLVTQTPSGGLDAFGFVWAADSQHMVYWGDLVTDQVNGIWSVDTTATLLAPVELVPGNLLTTIGDVRTDPQLDSSGRAYFKSAHEGFLYLYRNNIAGTMLEVVPGTETLMHATTQSEIGSYGISANGAKLAFSADSPDANLYQVFVMDLTTTTPNLVSGVSTMVPPINEFFGPFFNTPIAWSADGSKLAVFADWGDNDIFSAYVLPTSGAPGGVRIVQASGGQDVHQIAFTSDPQQLIIRGDLATDGSEELFATSDFATADQSAAAVLIEPAASGTAESFAFVIAP